MVLNKLFAKKEKTYFLEIDTTNDNQPSSEEKLNDSDSNVEISTIEGKETTVAVAVKPQGDVTYDVPDWVKAIKNYSNQDSNNASASPSKNFAGQYVSNSVAQSRRRPGPSLANFKKMASKIGK